MNFSLRAASAPILLKEFLQMRRDRLTLGMIIGIPLMQLVPVRLCHQSQSQGPADGRSRWTIPAPSRRSIVAALREFQLFQHRRRDQLARRRAPPAAGRQGALRGRDSGQFHPRHRARRPARSSDRGRRHRSRRRLLCARRPSTSWPPRRCATIWSDRWRRARKGRRPSTRSRICSTIRNPITQYNIVPGLLAIDPDHDHGADDLPGADPRARAGNLRKSAGHAGDAAGDHDRQDRAQYRRSAPSRARIILLMARYVFARADDRLAAACCRWRWPSTSSPIWRSAIPSRPSPRTSFRRCR